MTDKKLEISFKSDFCKVKKIVNDILSFISQVDISEEELFDMKLMLCELIFNAIIHGNRQNNQKNVYVSVEIKDGAILTAVSDEGSGFDYTNFIKTLSTESNLYNENGRGIRLILSLADDVSFNKNGSEIKFLKKVTIHG